MDPVRELHVGDLSALVLGFEDQRAALCTIRGLRDPTLGHRRSIAREELDRILRNGDIDLHAAARALQAFARCLRWEIGALWRGTSRGERLHCAIQWRAPQPGRGHFDEPTGYVDSPSRQEVLRRAWLRQPTWIPDVLADPGLSRVPLRSESLRGWLAFPALGADGTIGMVEFRSRETRQLDVELLAMIEDFGQLFGRVLEGVEAPGIRLVEQSESVHRGIEEPAPRTMPDAFRDLAGAVAAATEAMERHLALLRSVPPSAMLGELTVGVGKLNRLLEHLIQGSAGGLSALERAGSVGEATAEPPAALPTGLTLKAVSRRTGIPSATLRTWEHRYGFMRPRRSPSGYRLYGDEEIARIERVKYLVEQGVRIGVAMKAVIEEAGDSLLTEAQQPADQGSPEENSKHAEVYRLPDRSPRGRRSR